jgi:glycosyltransferase involved in cell wall biosynthesis
MKRVLMVAYHFPPLAGSSGIQRTLRFVQHLPALGWQPIVLTAHPRAYERTSDDLTAEVPDGVVVERAFALDGARHLSVGGHYPAFVARPDRWISWRFGAVPAGMRLIRDHRPDVIWSTYPIATAHVIGDALRQRSGLPWIADFRDPMAQDGYPEDPRTWRSFKRIEERAVAHARFSVFVTPGAARTYRDRYPTASDRIVVVENGFDEDSFAGLVAGSSSHAPLNPGMVTLVHSGVVYPSERDPTQLFIALRRMVERGTLRRDELRIRFRAAAHDALLRALARENGIEELIEVLPPIGYRAALEEMLRADGLLVLQAANCNAQIPAKLYEYLRASRPIVALTDPGGDTARVLRDAGVDTIGRLDSMDEIAALLGRFIVAVREKTAPNADPGYVGRASRRERAVLLAALFERACGSRGPRE